MCVQAAAIHPPVVWNSSASSLISVDEANVWETSNMLQGSHHPACCKPVLITPGGQQSLANPDRVRSCTNHLPTYSTLVPNASSCLLAGNLLNNPAAHCHCQTWHAEQKHIHLSQQRTQSLHNTVSATVSISCTRTHSHVACSEQSCHVHSTTVTTSRRNTCTKQRNQLHLLLAARPALFTR